MRPGVAYDAATQALVPPLIVRVTGDFDGAIQAAPTAELVADTKADLGLRVVNLGRTAWGNLGIATPTNPVAKAQPAMVIGRWIPLSDGAVQPTDPAVQTPLPIGIAPTDAVNATMSLTAPTAAGQYLLRARRGHAGARLARGVGRRAHPGQGHGPRGTGGLAAGRPIRPRADPRLAISSLTGRRYRAPDLRGRDAAVLTPRRSTSGVRFPGPRSRGVLARRDPAGRQIGYVPQRGVTVERVCHRDQPSLVDAHLSPVEELPAVIVLVVGHVEDRIALENRTDRDRGGVRRLVERPVVRLGAVPPHASPVLEGRFQSVDQRDLGRLDAAPSLARGRTTRRGRSRGMSRGGRTLAATPA